MQSIRILHIEDSERDYELVTRTIEAGGYRVESRRVDTAEALSAALAEQSWDIVLSDYSIPGFNSFDALRITHRHDEDLPFIVVSGTVGEETAVELMRAGAADYVMKDNLTRLVPSLAREVRDAEHRRARRKAEARLQERERMLTTAQRIANLGSWERNYQRNTLWWSEEFHAIVGRPRDYQPSTEGSYADAAFPGDREQVERAMAAALERGELQALEHRLVRADGVICWVYARLEPELDEHGNPLRLVGTVLDISELKEAEAELRFQAQLLDTVEQAVIATDLGGRIVYWNAFAESLYGWSAEEAEGRLILEVTPSLVSAEQAKEIWAHLERGESWVGEFRVQRRDGETFWAYVSDSPILNEDGNLIGMIGISFDISEQIRARETLQESETRYRTLLEQAADGIVVTDSDLRIMTANRRAREMFGYDREEFRGRHIFDFFHPEEATRNPPKVQEVDSGEIVLNERFLRRSDGSHFPAETSTKKFEDGTVQVIVRDITERKQAEAALRESEANYRTLMEEAADGIVVLDSDFRIVEVNPRACEMFGYDADELIGQEPFSYMHPDEARERLPAVLDMESVQELDRGSTVVNERRLRRKDGAYIPTEASTKKLADGRVLSVIRDVTERKEAEDALRRSEQDFRSLFENANDAIVVFNRETLRILDVNTRACTLYGYEREEIVDQSMGLLAPGQPDRELESLVKRVLTSQGEVELTRYRSDGQAVQILVSASEIDFRGQAAIMSIQHDVTEQKELERQLRFQTFYDSLTGLPNRALFQDRVKHALERVDASGAGRIAVIMLALDRFRLINESLGHEKGDHLLSAVAGRLNEMARAEDTVARIGGDEFAILLDGIDNWREATMVAERMTNLFDEPFDLDGDEVHVTASIGVVLNPEVRSTAVQLMRNVDIATYRAKADGRARYEMFDPSMDASSVEVFRLEGDLRRAIAGDELEVHFQPIVRVEHGAVTGMEALVRWNHPTKGRLPPALFIPIAEESDLIRSLGQWVLTESCRQWRSWLDHYAVDEPLLLNVNLSAREFQHPDLVRDVADVLSSTGLDPGSLQLEITESVIMADVSATDIKLRQLRELGVHLAIDDFGTGYSSLSYLKRFPVDTLKIDKSFISGLGSDSEDTAIVQAIISVAASLGLSVTAEGVETQEALDRLREMACSRAQGYFYCEPLPATSLTGLWTNRLQIASNWRPRLAS